MTRLARLRVPLGFLAAAFAFGFAHPSWRSWAIGLAVSLVGEGIRVWAAGHIEKGREITRSGPYRYFRHPLYLGSSMLGVGFAIASRSVPVAVLILLYLGLTITAAVRTEEAVLDAKFQGAYADYRAGRIAPVMRTFSVQRAIRNREYRALAGLAAAFVVLALRVGR